MESELDEFAEDWDQRLVLGDSPVGVTGANDDAELDMEALGDGGVSAVNEDAGREKMLRRDGSGCSCSCSLSSCSFLSRSSSSNFWLGGAGEWGAGVGCVEGLISSIALGIGIGAARSTVLVTRRRIFSSMDFGLSS